MRLVFTLITLLLANNSFAQANVTTKESQWVSDWQIENGEDGIRAQCREHRNKIKQCRFNAVVDESFVALSAVIIDSEKFPEWASGVLSAELLSASKSLDDFLLYTTYHFTGAYNRDAVTRYTATQDKKSKSVRIKFQTINQEKTKKDLRLVRFPLMAGYWQFTPLGNGKTEIEHLSFAPPGGVVQNTLYYLYNTGYLGASFDTIRALLKQAKKAEYQNATLDFIQ